MASKILSASKVAKLIARGEDRDHGDGEGLYLRIRNGGRAKSWVLRFVNPETGKPDVMGLGAVFKTDIHAARQLKEAAWVLIRQGKDPKKERDSKKLDEAHKLGLAKTVDQVVDEWFDAKINLPQRSDYTKQQTAYRLNSLVRRTIGHMPIQRVDTQVILETLGLRKMWTEKHPTAVNVQGELSRIFSLAIARKYYVGPNPALWKGHLEHILPASRDIRKVKHQSSVNHKEVGAFLESVRGHVARGWEKVPSNMAPLLEFVALTGCRPSEARVATWEHIERRDMVWTVPTENHKIGTRVTHEPILRPISKAMLAVLDEMERRYPDHASDAPIFPGQGRGRGGAFAHRSSLRQFLSRLTERIEWTKEITSAGFRNTFTDWAIANGYPKQLYEAQLGHVVGNRVARAYARDPLVNERRPMVEAWGQYCSQPTPEPIEDGSNIVNMRRKTA